MRLVSQHGRFWLRVAGLLALLCWLLPAGLRSPAIASPSAAPPPPADESSSSSSSSSTTGNQSGGGTVSVTPAYRQASKVAVLRVEGEIDLITLQSLIRRVEEAKALNADAIVFDINTLGGGVEPTLGITKLIKSECPPNTVAWINPDAYSAGTYIALACREIVVSPNATFGDAAPIIPGLDISQDLRSKMEAPLLTEVKDSARRNRYDEKLVQAFVTVGVELWLIEHTDTGDRIFVDREEYRTVFGEDPPTQMTATAPPEVVRQGAAPKPWINRLFEQQETIDREALTPEQREQMKQFEDALPSTRPVLTEEDRGEWQLIAQVDTKDQLLTLKPADAIYYGLAVDVIRNDAELKAYFGATELIRLDETWSEGLVRFLVSGWVRAVLIAIFIIALFIELAAPGLGVFGATALAALVVLIGAPYLIGMAQWWEVLLIVLGLALIAVELFVIPGTVIAGVSGAMLLLVGLVGTFITGGLDDPVGQGQLVTGIVATLAGCMVAGVGIWVLSRQMDSLPFFSKLVLSAGTSVERAGEPTSLLGAMGSTAKASLEPGAEGTASTDLRPSGRALFDGRMVDVVSSGGYIERGTRIRVVSVGRFRIEVEAANA